MMENKIRQRLVLQQTCQEQMAFKEMRKQAEKEEDEEFRRMMLAKFAEDDRIEQMNAQKRRMKQLEHRRAVEKILEDRRQQHEADKVQLFCNPSSQQFHSATVQALLSCKLVVHS